MPTMLAKFCVDLETDGSITMNGESLDRAAQNIDLSEWKKVDVQRQYYVSCRVAQTLVLVRILAKDQREKEDVPEDLRAKAPNTVVDGRRYRLIHLVFEKSHDGKVQCCGCDLDVKDSPFVVNESMLSLRTSLAQKLLIVQRLTEFWEDLNSQHKRQRVREGELVEENGNLRSTTNRIVVGP